MSAENFAKHLLQNIEERAASIRNAVICGAPKDYAQYQSMTGELRGLDRAAFLCREQISPMLERGHPIREEHHGHS